MIYSRIVCLLLFALLAAAPEFVFAQQGQNLGGVASNITSQMSPVMQAITSVLFVVGIGFLGSTFLTLKRLGLSEHSYSSLSLKNPLLSAVAGIGLLYLTTVGGIGGATIFGPAASNVTVSGRTTLQ